LKFKKEGKTDNINNWQITHVETNRQKADDNPFIIGNTKYQIKRVKNLYEEDRVAPYPYEKNGKKYCIIIMEEMYESKNNWFYGLCLFCGYVLWNTWGKFR
jgi:hypothetical protein